MTLSSEQLKLIERYMDASEEMLPILKKGFNAMLTGAKAKDAEATRAGLKKTIEDMKQFKDIMNIDTFNEIHQIIEQESGLKYLDVPAFVTAAGNWESHEKGLKWIVYKDDDNIRFGDVSSEMAALKGTIDALPEAIKWLEDFLLKASKDTGKAYRSYRKSDGEDKEQALVIVREWLNNAQMVYKSSLSSLSKLLREAYDENDGNSFYDALVAFKKEADRIYKQFKYMDEKSYRVTVPNALCVLEGIDDRVDIPYDFTSFASLGSQLKDIDWIFFGAGQQKEGDYIIPEDNAPMLPDALDDLDKKLNADTPELISRLKQLIMRNSTGKAYRSYAGKGN